MQDMDRFQGDIIPARMLHDATVLKDRRVLVLGGGKSSCVSFVSCPSILLRTNRKPVTASRCIPAAACMFWSCMCSRDPRHDWSCSMAMPMCPTNYGRLTYIQAAAFCVMLQFYAGLQAGHVHGGCRRRSQ